MIWRYCQMMLPLQVWIRRNKAKVKEDLPLPVRPQIPTYFQTIQIQHINLQTIIIKVLQKIWSRDSFHILIYTCNILMRKYIICWYLYINLFIYEPFQMTIVKIRISQEIISSGSCRTNYKRLPLVKYAMSCRDS